MRIKFESEHTSCFVLSDDVASPLLRMMGINDTLDGTVSGEELSGALDQLQAALRHYKNPIKTEADEKEEKDLPIALATRAVPLMEMLKNACETGGHVSWHPE